MISGSSEMEPTISTIQATLLDLLPSNPSALLYEKQARYKGGSRLFTQKVNVPDESLFQRLCHEASKGSEIKITVTTEWREDHSVAYVSDAELLQTATCEALVSAA